MAVEVTVVEVKMSRRDQFRGQGLRLGNVHLAMVVGGCLRAFGV
jgi:hypothetical protein